MTGADIIEARDLLLEIGTEELPPMALESLSASLTRELVAGLDGAGLSHGEARGFATPRRLAVLVEAVAARQPDRELERRGPALAAAFDDAGNPTRAAEGFARSCGLSVTELDRLETPKGAWLVARVHQPGKPAAQLLPDIAAHALARLPTPKRMRWGDSTVEFVRPVHWLVLLHGPDVVPCTLLGAPADRLTRGHRFHHPGAIRLDAPASYPEVLATQGRVLADLGARRERIRSQVEETAASLGGTASFDDALLSEVAALVEWPVPVAAGFEDKYLEVPHEALVLTMKKNQKYFPLVDADGALMSRFVAIANIESRDPDVVRAGNERVVRPRLADAMFFWEQDGRQTLESRLPALREVVFQSELGSLYDKSERVAALAAVLAPATGADPELARRAGLLSRCDLVTEMVFELPEMQGVMGRYQARRDGEPEELAAALDEAYMPRYSGDRLPATPTGTAVALADRLDTLAGIFGIGQRPTGDKDPFALRRAALGALRILRDHHLPVGLEALLEEAVALLGPRVRAPDTVAAVHAFMLERLRVLYADEGLRGGAFEAVAAAAPETVADLDRRLRAVVAFRELPEAEALAAANKRIRNILRKAGGDPPGAVDPGLFADPAEQALRDALESVSADVAPLLAASDYSGALRIMAALRAPVDRFFDQVMVMAEDAAVRGNRLALLAGVTALFQRVADISLLEGLGADAHAEARPHG